MGYFTNLIAKSCTYINDEEIDIALLYFNEFLKVKPGTDGETNFSKDYFFKKLISNIDLLIDGCFTRYSEPVFDPSKMDYETYEYQLNQRREIIEEEVQNDFYNEEINNIEPATVNWEKCDDAGKLIYAVKYNGISLKDPINIITYGNNKIVLRKSKLEFLKLEAERANISTIFNDIEGKSRQDKTELISNDNDANFKATQILNEKLDIISKEIESINTNNPKSDFLTAKEAAKFLNLSIHTIHSYTHKNLIPHMKKGKNLIFSRVELTEYLKSGKVKTIAEIENDADNFVPKSKRK